MNADKINNTLFSGLTAHSVNGLDEIISVELMTERRILLNDENIDIIYQFQCCSNFFVEICLNYRHSNIDLVVEVRIRILRLWQSNVSTVISFFSISFE